MVPCPLAITGFRNREKSKRWRDGLYVRNVMNETKGALLTDIIGSSRTKKGEPERSEPDYDSKKTGFEESKTETC